MPAFVISEELVFPPPQLASPEGLLAIGGDLSQERLLLAYRKGIFPWFSDDQPILWWSPDPRLVLYPEEIRVSRRLRRTIRQEKFDVTMDRAFEQVIRSCACSRRRDHCGTWIVEDMIVAYCELHRAGYAHSVEAWRQGRLVGGLYGVSMGGCFFGESMFADARDASKVAFVCLADFLRQNRFSIIDCQVSTAHLRRFGAREIPRKTFISQLEQALRLPTLQGKWPL